MRPLHSFLYLFAILLFTFQAQVVLADNEKDSTRVIKQKPIFTTNLNKGDFFVGGTLGLSTKETSNRNIIFTNIDDENSTTFSFRFDGGYALKDNLFVGLGVQYGQTKRKGNYQNTDDVLSYQQYYSNSMSYRPFIKNYVPLSSSRRFNLVTQTELSFSLTQSVLQTTQNSEIPRTFSRQYDLGVGIRPGILVFVVDNFAIETSVNVAGITYSFLKQEKTNEANTTVKKGSIDFKLDILQLNLGFFVYF